MSPAISKLVNRKAQSTSLCDAAALGDLLASRKAVASGVSLDTPDSDGSTAMLHAVANGQVKAVRALLRAGANVNARARASRRQTPLLEASSWGHEAIVRVLLKQPGLRIDARDDGGTTALHWAAMYGRLRVAVMLIRAGAKVDARDSNGFTPFTHAAGEGCAPIVKLLLRAGANVNARVRGQANSTALHVAAIWGRKTVVKAILASGKARVEMLDGDGRSALDLSIAHGHKGVSRWLRAHPAKQKARAKRRNRS